MKVKLVDQKGKVQRLEQLDRREVAEYDRDYVNGVTGRRDPMLDFGDGLIVHWSTLQWMRLNVVDVETGEIVMEGA